MYNMIITLALLIVFLTIVRMIATSKPKADRKFGATPMYYCDILLMQMIRRMKNDHQ